MGNINFDFNFWTMALLLLNFALALFVAMTNRGKAQADELKSVKNGLHTDIQDLGKQVNKHGERLAAIEAEVENGITKTDLAAVYDRVNMVASSTDSMSGQLKEISTRMASIDAHLLQLFKERK
ncbi:MAG: hypothetical protein PHR16_11905 [Methylovulum sp.]|nr:hypothetical protein [Methylovulum sp.]